MIQQLMKEVKVSVAADAATAAASTITGSAIDMAGYDSVVFMAALGTANAGNYLYAAQGSDAAMSDEANIEGSKIVASADNELMILEIVKPQDRYLRPYVARGASSTCSPIVAIQYNARSYPVDSNDTGEVQVESHVSPSEGTP